MGYPETPQLQTHLLPQTTNWCLYPIPSDALFCWNVCFPANLLNVCSRREVFQQLQWDVRAMRKATEVCGKREKKEKAFLFPGSLRRGQWVHPLGQIQHKAGEEKKKAQTNSEGVALILGCLHSGTYRFHSKWPSTYTRVIDLWGDLCTCVIRRLATAFRALLGRRFFGVGKDLIDLIFLN